MIPSLPESQHYEYWANYYASTALEFEFSAYVHVEALDDAVFWQKTFTHFLPDKKFNFMWVSYSPFGKETSGSAQCLKYKDYLSKQFFICIDSDYRYLLQEAGLSSENFVFQTYTHSIENHLCYKSKLNAIAEKCTGVANTVFDFEAFLLAYSNAIYEAFIWHLYFLRNGDEVIFGKDEFTSILQLNGMTGFSIDNHGEGIISELSARCNAKTAQLRATYPNINIAPEQIYFTTLGLTRDNAYLYLRGHNVFDLIVKVGKKINDILLAQQRQRLDLTGEAVAQLFANSIKFEDKLKEEIIFDGYEQIEKITTEMIQFI